MTMFSSLRTTIAAVIIHLVFFVTCFISLCGRDLNGFEDGVSEGPWSWYGRRKPSPGGGAGDV